MNSRSLLPVDELAEQESPEVLVVGELGDVGQEGSEERDAVVGQHGHVVAVGVGLKSRTYRKVIAFLVAIIAQR